MRQSLAPVFILLAACSAAPAAAPTPISSAPVDIPLPAVSASAPPDLTPVSVSIAETHRFFVAQGSFSVPLVDPAAISKRLPAAKGAKLDAIARDAAAFSKLEAASEDALYANEMCAVSDPPRPCGALEAKANVASSKADAARTALDTKVADLLAALDDSPASMLASAWLEDVSMATGLLERHGDASIEASFELGESASVDVQGGAYGEAAASIPATDPLGVGVRVRAAVSALVADDPDTAVTLLEEAKAASSGADRTDVLYLLGQAHGRRAGDAKETERAFEEALKSTASPRVHRADIGTALALAAYRASDFSRALEISLDLEAGRVTDPPPPGAKPNYGVLGILALPNAGGILDGFDGTTRDLIEIEVGSIERLGLDKADLAKAEPRDAERIYGALALRALYVGDVQAAAAIVRAHAGDVKDESDLALAASVLCDRGASTKPIACDSVHAPRNPKTPDFPSLDHEVREGARSTDPADQRQVFALARLCIEPELVGLLPRRRARGKAAPDQHLVVEIARTDIAVLSEVPDQGEALAAVVACMKSIAPARFASSEHRITATIDLTHVGDRRDLLGTMGVVSGALNTESSLGGMGLIGSRPPPSAGGGASLGGVGGVGTLGGRPAPGTKKKP